MPTDETLAMILTICDLVADKSTPSASHAITVFERKMREVTEHRQSQNQFGSD